MANHHVTLSDEEVEHEAVEQKGHYWWRSAAKFQECANLQLFTIPNLSNISPKFNLLREMERLALSSPDGLEDLRHKLFRYRSGDLWVPTGGIMKEDMDIPPVITILLVGFHSAGKSSLVNLMYSVLGRSGLVPFAQTSSAGSIANHTTMFMGEHNVLRSPRSGFCVYDTRGFDYDRMDEAAQQLSEWMVDGVHHNQVCSRHGDNLLSENETSYLKSSFKYATRKVNCVMVVANVAEIHKSLNAEDMEPLVSLRQLYFSPVLRKCNENPILILTHGDKLSTDDRIDVRIKICEYFGVSEIAGVYDIFCLSEYGFVADDVDPVTAYAVTEAIYKALLISDRSHLPKTRLTDRMISALSWFLWSIGSLFALIARFFYKLGQMGKMRF